VKPLWHADIVILTALEEEHDAMVRYLGKTEKQISHSGQQYQTCYVNDNLVALPVACGQGQLNTCAATVKAINDLMPDWLLLIGIAGVLKNDISLGDILVAEHIIDYELAKLREIGKTNDRKTKSGAGKPGRGTSGRRKGTLPETEFRQISYPSSTKLIDVAKAIDKAEWTRQGIASKRPDKKSNMPRVRFGAMFCGNKVVAASRFADELRRLYPAALGLEMEGAGAAAILKAVSDPPAFLMIKSAVDRCDGTKNDRWHQYGDDAAASFCCALLRSAPKLAAKTIDQYALESMLHTQLAAGAPARLNPAESGMLDSYTKRGVEISVRALRSKFEVDVSSGGHFLSLAEPIFESAKAVYATSIDTVSRFWVDPKKRRAAYEYLKQHKDGTHRLFVFHDRETAHLHAKVLDEHAKKYKHVYYCTDGAYREILRNISVSAEVQNQRDFAILDCSADDRKALYFAELDEDNYQLEVIPHAMATPRNIIFQKFIDYFSCWQKLKDGAGSDGVFKWEIGAWKSTDAWAKSLDDMFGVQTLDTCHFVYVRPDHASSAVDSVRELLSNVRRVMQKERGSAGEPTMAERYNIKDIWFGESLELTAIDGRYRGRLQRYQSPHCENHRSEFVLAMKFASSEDLERFYQDKKHSEVRQKLYEALDRRVEVVFRKIEEMRNQQVTQSENLGRIIEHTYELIEDCESAYLSRLDFRSGEKTHHMVSNVSPAEFSPP